MPKMSYVLRFSHFCIILFLSGNIFGQESQVKTADVIIYGGTSAAVTAAVEVRRSGKSVIVVSPDKHLGGLSSGGLGWTDSGDKRKIGGLSREFYHRVWLKYQEEDNWPWEKSDSFGTKRWGNPEHDKGQTTMWVFEPHIAEEIFDDFIEEHEIKVFKEEWLDRMKGVEVKEGKITSITTLSGNQYQGEVFIDATYEGDLMASAGVSYHVGRESKATYGEEWNGVQTGVLHHKHWFMSDISPYIIPGDPSSGVLPRISTELPGEKYEGDDKIQAYCFRVCMTNHETNRIPFPKPEGYDVREYELLARMFETGRKDWFEKFDRMPNHKTDTNNHGPFSSDNIGMNYDYPDATYERREEIIKEHEIYQKGLLWFVANDPRVPEDIQSEMKKWGLPKDEFVDNGHWPHQLYIREARRMIGDHIMTENELLKRKETPRSVGMGSYKMDSHNVQRYIKEDGYVQNEGDIGVSTKGAYKISYGSLTPKKEECENLLVPVCVSSSHIAYGSIRMEPVFMILGQSAGAAAVLAINQQVAVQEVNYSELSSILLARGQILE